jgi:hypothetical protein
MGGAAGVWTMDLFGSNDFDVIIIYQRGVIDTRINFGPCTIRFRRQHAQSNPSCRNLRSKLQILVGIFNQLKFTFYHI